VLVVLCFIFDVICCACYLASKYSTFVFSYFSVHSYVSSVVRAFVFDSAALQSLCGACNPLLDAAGDMICMFECSLYPCIVYSAVHKPTALWYRGSLEQLYCA
jgi:hypothetical protein